MKLPTRNLSGLLFAAILILSFSCSPSANNENLTLSDLEYFEARGVNYLIFSNWYNGYFSDSKMSGVEMIHHGTRTATNGDVRLSPTPEQWDPIPVFVDRNIDPDGKWIEAKLSYPDYNFNYRIKGIPNGSKMLIQLILDEALPASLIGKAGLNIEFLPASYFRKTYLMDSQPHTIPLYAAGTMERKAEGQTEALPLATGKKLILSPEDPERMLSLSSSEEDISIYDGRNKAQNGWLVVRSLIPANKTGIVLEWTLEANTIKNWSRDPVISHSQVGYHPSQEKIALIELDKYGDTDLNARLLKIDTSGAEQALLNTKLNAWQPWLRYTYGRFDFSEIKDEGIYVIAYGKYRSEPFIIGKNVYSKAWQPTLDIYMPVQMDHMFVNEAYRVWHGAAHLDDARQAPVNHEHFDLYAQGPTTDTPYKPGEHIPGLNVGGWFDAGDYDIRTQSQYATVMSLVQIWENFTVTRDQTLVDQENRYVDLHVPDGSPDLLQQIEHGALALLAQHKAVGHAIPGIIVSDISQYTHLGDALTMTDNRIYDNRLKANENRGEYSGRADDRWAFTSRSTPLNYGSAAALAATYRALKMHNPSLAAECLETAKSVWDEEQAKEPDIFSVGNTTGGNPDTEEFRAAVELLEACGDEKYRQRIMELYPLLKKQFSRMATLAARLIPLMDADYKALVKDLCFSYKTEIDSLIHANPFGVPIRRGGWAGSGSVIAFSINNYYLHKAFPDIISTEDVFKGMNYIYGCHPGSSISLVSGVGTRSKEVAYGMNRADYSYIAGGIVPGVLILAPDFPENKEDWPFLWGENEYVIPLGPDYIFAVHAVQTLLQ